MFRTILVYGAIAGTIIIATMVGGIMLAGSEGGAGSLWFGYLTMLVAFSLIFVGIKRYRDNQLGGVIKFWPAFGLGIGIGAVAGLFYVIGWEISLHMTDFAYLETYREGMENAYRAKDLADDVLAKKLAGLDEMMVNYMNPLYRMPLTFLEPSPVSLVVSLISAALLRNPKVFPARV